MSPSQPLLSRVHKPTHAASGSSPHQPPPRTIHRRMLTHLFHPTRPPSSAATMLGTVVGHRGVWHPTRPPDSPHRARDGGLNVPGRILGHRLLALIGHPRTQPTLHRHRRRPTRCRLRRSLLPSCPRRTVRRGPSPTLLPVGLVRSEIARPSFPLASFSASSAESHFLGLSVPPPLCSSASPFLRLSVPPPLSSSASQFQYILSRPGPLAHPLSSASNV
ncbi:hypothetical protein C8Q80DRAFT_588335 [Daedaleopsis nitida]|nr:hypothetical protein C8Q80DRAFT_588335 [Daedaleopsis nitida]